MRVLTVWHRMVYKGKGNKAMPTLCNVKNNPTNPNKRKEDVK